MRQKYIAGRMDRQRYMDDYNFLDQKFISSQIEVHSTSVLRVLQSSYSELLGFYLPGENQQILSDSESSSLQSGKGMPPMKIRKATQINDQLGQAAIIDGYVQIPVFTHSQESVQDDVAYTGCKNSMDGRHYYEKKNDTFIDIQQPYFDILKKPIQIAFNLTQHQTDKLTFDQLYLYCDIIKAEKFQGNAARYNFTDAQWYYVESIQKYMVLSFFSEESRALMGSRMLRYPMGLLQAKVDAILEGTT